MTPQRLSRTRVIVAALVPVALLTLIGLGLTAFQAYRLSAWGKAEATYVGSEPVILVRGSSVDHTYSEVHYRFAKKDGSEVQLYFLERASAEPTAKSMAVLYDPSVQGEITRSEGSRWDRASSVKRLLTVGLVLGGVGLLLCLAGVALLVRERRKARPPILSAADLAERPVG
jgi:hypothetical protein